MYECLSSSEPQKPKEVEGCGQNMESKRGTQEELAEISRCQLNGAL